MANNKKKVPQLTAKDRASLIKKLDNVSATKRAKNIFKMRFGLEDGITKSNGETGRKFKITREAVRQTIVKVESLF